MIFATSLVIVAIAVAYAIGRHHGWMSAQAAWREQREPLPSLSKAQSGDAT